MAKDDGGKSGEGGLDLKDLIFGTLNFLRDDSINDSGDRRRGNPLSFLVQTMAKAYGIDTLKDVTDFRGIVVESRKVDGIVPISRSQVLNAYLNVSLGAKILKAITGDETVYAYKVYIPELEMRPPPTGKEDPVIDTYADVYDGRVDPNEIKDGTVVTVVFEDFKNLLNPRIIAAEKKPLIIKGFYEGSIADALKSFFSGSPDKEKVGDTAGQKSPDGGGTPAVPVSPVPRHPDDAPTITRMSDAAREKKRKAEGTVLKLYNDPYGYCTIGKGHLIQGRVNGKGWKGPCSQAKTHGLIPEKWLKGGLPPDGKNTRAPGETMTQAEAEALFIEDISSRERQLVRWLKHSTRKSGGVMKDASHDGKDVRVTQNQFDALMSAVYNAGMGNVRNKIIRPYLKKGDFEGGAGAFTVYGQMGYYREDHKRFLKGLKRLREKERALFASA
jgi:GH24 family phage-related lysozyme (muramidase)